MTEGRIRVLPGLLVAVLALTLAGCGGMSLLPGHRRAALAPTVGQDGPPADPGKVAVVKKWAQALQAGDVAAAAKFFRLPSVFSNGEGPQQIHSLAQAEAANATLPCGATFISAFRQGQYINVLFRLTNRPGLGGGPDSCGGGAGETGRTAFLIANGLIVQWLRAPTEPGDPEAPTSTSGGAVV